MWMMLVHLHVNLKDDDDEDPTITPSIILLATCFSNIDYLYTGNQHSNVDMVNLACKNDVTVVLQAKRKICMFYSSLHKNINLLRRS